MDNMTENILMAWASATPSQIARGKGWYQSAHDLAWIITSGDVVKGAGVLAALSPQKSWDINRRLAITACMTGEVSGHVTDAVNKAKAILEGVNPAMVLPKDRKTWHFFHNILRPWDAEFVTVDRHWYRVATGDWENGNPTIKPKLYSEIVTATQNAAIILREWPSTVQAGGWIWARER